MKAKKVYLDSPKEVHIVLTWEETFDLLALLRKSKMDAKFKDWFRTDLIKTIVSACE